MTIRKVTAEERLTTALPLTAYAFQPSPPTAEQLRRVPETLPYTSGCVTYVAEDGGTTLAAVTGIPMRQNVRGCVFPMAGVAAVATHPLARRQGHIRTLLTRLLGEMRDDGHAVSALYPFRPSFYGRFGYIGLLKTRQVTFAPEGLGQLLTAPLPGELAWERIKDGYDAYRDFTHRILALRHGFAVFPDYRGLQQRDADDRWVVTARVDGETVGAVTYRIERHGGLLAADDLLTTDALGRALLLQFFARHVDQVARVTARITPDETPEVWATDLAVHVEADVSFPGAAAPMARVLSVEALAGIAAGSGRVHVEVVDDPFLAGHYVLDANDGRLEVARATVGEPRGEMATLTAAGLSGLVYGVLDPADVVVRGLGSMPADAAAALRRLFPREAPYLFADF